MRTTELGSQPGHSRRDGDSWGLSHAFGAASLALPRTPRDGRELQAGRKCCCLGPGQSSSSLYHSKLSPQVFPEEKTRRHSVKGEFGRSYELPRPHPCFPGNAKETARHNCHHLQTVNLKCLEGTDGKQWSFQSGPWTRRSLTPVISGICVYQLHHSIPSARHDNVTAVTWG